MNLGIAEDFTSNIVLDSELKAIPTSGLFLNSGVHPSITVNNLLHFLPILDVVTESWDIATTYGIYSETRNIDDVVLSDSKIYQSIKAGVGNATTDADYWLETNLESLRLKNLIQKVEDKVYSDLFLNRRLVENQYLYEVGDSTYSLPNDYAAWVFEPKGSDYTTIRINEIAFQKKSTTPVNLYVINQGVLVDTLSVTPKDGRLDFDRLDYTFKGKGRWLFAIDSTDVETNGRESDPFRNKGFTSYTASGTGSDPETADWTYGTLGNGLGFNITAYLDSSNYINNNIYEFGDFIRATFEYIVFQMFYYNSNNVSNDIERNLLSKKDLLAEIKDLKYDTVVKRYADSKRNALKDLKKTFDKQIGESSYKVKIGTW